jgi:NADH dehydrogenase
MTKTGICVVTGAFSYTGKYITRGLLAKGYKVRTITGHCEANQRNPGIIEVCPYNFDSPAWMEKAFEGAYVFYNTYWVRFPYQGLTYEQAVQNNRILISAAKKAGVPRIVNISITNPSMNSPFPYFRGKAAVDDAIMTSGMSYAIIRPTVIFGKEDILINNIAWLLRKFPLFAVPGKGDYKIQPIFVEDLAHIAVEAGEQDNKQIIDAAGPDIFTFKEMVKLIARKIGRRVLIFPFPPELFILSTKFFNPLLSDVLLTSDEVYGLMANLLFSTQKPLGKTRLGDWLEQNRDTVGKDYASELKRHFI